jgi:hypothetical protein
MNNKFYKPVIFLGGILYPFYALPWTIKSMLKNEFLGYILFSFFMGLLAYTMIPYDTFDITRHYEIFEDVSILNFNDVYNYGRVFNYVLNLYMWFVSHIGLNKEFIPFSIIFTIYMLYFLTLKKVIDDRYYISGYVIDKKWLTIVGLFLIINQIQFIGTASGLRNGLAFAIFIYAVVDFYLKKRKGILIFLTLVSIFIHFSVIPLMIIFFLSNIIKLKKVNRVFFILSFLLLFSGMTGFIFYKIIALLEPVLRANGLYFHAYLDPDGAWGSGYWQGKNIKTIIFERIINPLPFYLVGIYLILIKNITIQRRHFYLYMLFIFIVLVSVSRTMFDRYSYFFVMLFIFVFLIELKTKTLTKFKKSFIIFFIASMLLVDFGGIVKYRDIYVKSWLKFLYVPTPYMALYQVSENDYIKRDSL